MTSRRSRRTRPPARRYKIVPRDIEILLAVGRMAQATSEHLRRLFFGDPSTAARRLAKLVALRLLDVHVVHQDEPNVYVLNTKGLEFLEETGADVTTLYRSRVR